MGIVRLALFGGRLLCIYYASKNCNCPDQSFSHRFIIAGVIRIFSAVIFKTYQGWGWTLFSGILTLVTGILILMSPDAPFWVLGLFLAVDILFQGINYLTLASYIKHDVPKSSADI